MNRSKIPLTALRSFEAAGRHESFSQAAKELFVSQTAISRQIGNLEQMLSKALFIRSHRRVHLTSEGKQLLKTLTNSFDAIANELIKIEDKKSTIVSISVDPEFASIWLVPNLKKFNAARGALLHLNTVHLIVNYLSSSEQFCR